MVGSLMDPDAPSETLVPEVEEDEEGPVPLPEGPLDPWQASA
jgi:hypothetical protein